MKISLTMLSLMSCLTCMAGASSCLAGLMDEQALEVLLVQDCGSCHGLTMRGGLGPALLPETLSGKPDELLVATILEGRPGTAMPPWKELLDRDDASWMVERLKRGLQ